MTPLPRATPPLPAEGTPPGTETRPADLPRATLLLPAEGTPPGTETRPAGETCRESGSRPTDASLPTRIGRFEVIALLGEGAFGEVFLARDPQLERDVAVKWAKPSAVGSPERVKRFLREAKAAATLRHPNLVPLYETGEESSRPFLVSAYIAGRTLEAMTGGNPMPICEAAEVVRKLADALAYAHREGVIHRDVKPANMMMDVRGEPHLTDFGLAARAVAGDEKLTQDGAGVGTPAYMAPEQAEGQGTAASDQYSLGCTLYELLTGRTPFEGPPSVQLMLHASLDPAPVRRLLRDVPRDLSTVVHKCMEKEPAARYPSCGELAEDLRRFLAGEPVNARRLSWVGRLGKFARRNPGLAVSVATAIVAMTIGTGVSLWQLAVARAEARRADHESMLARQSEAEAKRQEGIAVEKATLAVAKAEEAAREATRATQVSDFMGGLFRDSDPLAFIAGGVVPPSYETLKTRTARDLLDAATEQFKSGLAEQPLVRAKLLVTVGESYRNLGEFAKAEPLLHEAIRLLQAHGSATETAGCEVALGQLALDTGDFELAERRLRHASEAQAVAGVDPKMQAITDGYVAWSVAMQRRPEAEHLFREQIDLRAKLYGPLHAQTLFMKFGLIAHYLNEGRAADALPRFAELAEEAKAMPEGQIRSCIQAGTLFQKGVGLRFAAHKAGPLKVTLLREAVAAHQASLAKASKSFPPIHIYVAMIRFELGAAYNDLQDDANAETEFRVVIDIARKTSGLAHPKALLAVNHYADFLSQRKRANEALALYAEADAAVAARYGKDSPRRLPTLCQLGRALKLAGQSDKAAAIASEVLRTARAGITSNRQAGVLVHNFAFDLASSAHTQALACDLFVAALMLKDAAGEANTQSHFDTLYERNEVLRKLGRWAESRECMRQAVEVADKLGGMLPTGDRALATEFRALLERDRGRYVDAEPHYRNAVTLANQAKESNVARRLGIDLAGVLAEQGRYSDAAETYSKATGLDKAKLKEGDSHGLKVMAMLEAAGGDKQAIDASLKALATISNKTKLIKVKRDHLRAMALATGFADAVAWQNEVAALIALKPTATPLTYRTLALAYLRAGNLTAAARMMEASRGDDGSARSQFVLGLISCANGDVTRARQYLEAGRAFSTPADKDHPFAKWLWVDRLEAGMLERELAWAIETGTPE